MNAGEAVKITRHRLPSFARGTMSRVERSVTKSPIVLIGKPSVDCVTTMAIAMLSGEFSTLAVKARPKHLQERLSARLKDRLCHLTANMDCCLYRLCSISSVFSLIRRPDDSCGESPGSGAAEREFRAVSAAPHSERMQTPQVQDHNTKNDAEVIARLADPR
jgi:hypothetical protein